MAKNIFIVNGSGGVGKDTFAELLDLFVDVEKISSVDFVKEVAKTCGWDGSSKGDKDRKFLSDLKIAMSEYNDLPFRRVRACVYKFECLGTFKDHVLLIDIREPEEIERAKKTFGAKTILIKNDRVAPITSNMADANVLNYNYDFVIENNGTLEEFEETIKKWAEENVM